MRASNNSWRTESSVLSCSGNSRRLLQRVTAARAASVSASKRGRGGVTAAAARAGGGETGAETASGLGAGFTSGCGGVGRESIETGRVDLRAVLAQPINISAANAATRATGKAVPGDFECKAARSDE